jgi:Tc5 transposase DNA-binding domain
MVFLNDDLDELAEQAAQEVRRVRASGGHVAVAAVAREYRVDRRRVCRRLQGIGSRSSRKPVNYKLSDVQEVTLLNWVLTLDEIGVGLRLDQLSNAANSILKQDYTGDGEPLIVSVEWPRRFIERQPDLHKMRQKPIELVRKLAHDPEVILSWFQ